MSSVFIIAEAGVNHNGDIALAKKLIDKAKESGADAVKFQTFVSKNIVSKFARKADYQEKSTGSEESQLEMIKKLELSFEGFIDLYDYCKVTGIEFMSTAFDFDSIEFLKKLDMKYWKVPSGEITNLPYLTEIGKIGASVILSTGMSDMGEIRQAIDVLKKSGTKDITVLHCTTEYPAPLQEVNLLAMNTIGKEFNLPIGYSDHTDGIEVSVAAVALGATVIEKHFTLDKTMEGPDHKASLEPDELKSMVKSIRNVEKALGSSEKTATPTELKNRVAARKSIVAKKNIEKGDVFGENNLTVKRPGNGISPMKWYEVMGEKAKRNFAEDELIEL